MNTISRKKRNAGFTLVEVIVTLVITLIIIGVSGAIIISVTNIFAKSAARDLQQNIAETVLSFTAERMLYAYDIEAKPTRGSDPGKAVLGIDENGQLLFLRADDSPPPINIFGSKFYSNYSVLLTYKIEQSDDGSFSVYITAVLTDERNGGEVLSRSITRPLLNYKGPAVGEINIGKNTTNRYIIIS